MLPRTTVTTPAMAAVFELPPFRGEGVGGPVEDALEADVGVTDTPEGASKEPRTGQGPSSG
jgi:hypothetical protein